MEYLKFLSGDNDVEIPVVGQLSNKKRSFQDVFCLKEVEAEEFPKICYGADPLTVIPGKYVEGKGLRSELRQCLIKIRKNEECFVYQNGENIQDEKNQELDGECMLIFLGDAKEAFILLPDENASGRKLFRFEEDVEIGVYLETDLYNGRNGYYCCLIKDTAYEVNMCSVTADSRSAEFMFRFLISWFG